jgi:hypothetical protein
MKQIAKQWQLPESKGWEEDKVDCINDGIRKFAILGKLIFNTTV